MSSKDKIKKRKNKEKARLNNNGEVKHYIKANNSVDDYLASKEVGRTLGIKLIFLVFLPIVILLLIYFRPM